ncbi:MAG TPA: DNA internalization-related competence protein ComEC/Rec2 [Candidatus Angelobacter sp.]|nr:DNA internalization-related competence protein ComEC/Rec2 [Candidatus Angelobacter sp.]
MGAARWVLPCALVGVAAGILADDHGLAAEPALGAAMALIGLVAGVLGGRVGAAGLLSGVVVAGLVLGAWRHDPPQQALAGSDGVASLVDGSEYGIAGTILDDPRPRADRLQIVLGDLVVERDGRPAKLSDRLLVWLPRGADLRSGTRLAIRARIDLAEDFDGFAYREYLARQGIGAIARARRAEPVGEPSGPAGGLSALRAALLGGITAVVPEPEAALGAGILLGVRTSIAPEVADDFATAGLTHVVAISGWNIAIVVALVGAVLRPLERRPGGRWTTAAVATLTVTAYVLLTGASPSVVRAALMAGALLVGRFAGSRAHATSALGMAALVMLLAAPSVLWDVGFQLSFLATAGLVWFGRPIESRMGRWPGWIREPVALTLAAQLTTLPVILVNFERVSLVAPIANVLVVPIVPLVMAFTAMAAVLGIVAEALRDVPVAALLDWVAAGPAWLLLRAMITIGATAASIPGAAVDLQVPTVVAVAWLPVLAFASWALHDPGRADPDRRAVPDEAMTGALAGLSALVRPPVAGAALVATLVAITIASRPDGRLHLTVLDIGQGDAILIEAANGATALVDGGPDPERTLRRLGASLPFFARRIDLLVLSHPHQDHVGGLVDVLDRFRVGALLHAGIPFENDAYHRLLADARASGVRLHEARAGNRVHIAPGTMLDVLYPSAADATAPLPDGDINNGSIVALLRHGGFAALLTGDAEEPVENALVLRGGLPPVDMLKVGHHGSHSSTMPAFLHALDPGVAVISAGADNEYGHPAAETLATLGAQPGLVVLRTDLHGDVEVVSDGSSWSARTETRHVPPRTVHAMARTGSIGPWPSPIDRPHAGCSPMPGCPTASWSIPRAWPGLQKAQRDWWPVRGSRSTSSSWWLPRCCTTSTRSRSGARAASTASSARAASRRRGTRSSRSRSPPIRSSACSTTIAFRSAGHRSSSPWRTGTWPRSS